jgi:hypothetical protein
MEVKEHSSSEESILWNNMQDRTLLGNFFVVDKIDELLQSNVD